MQGVNSFKHHARPRFQFLPGMHQRLPDRVSRGQNVRPRPDQETLDRAAAGDAAAEQPRGKHARVVDDDQIAGAQQLGQRGDMRVREGAAVAIEDTAAAPRRVRPAAPGRSARKEDRSRTRGRPWSAVHLSGSSQQSSPLRRLAILPRGSSTAPDRDTRRCAGTISAARLRAPRRSFRSAPVPRPFLTAARASSRCAPIASNANSITSLRAVHEHARAPELGREREPPLGRTEVGLERPHLKQADRRVGSARHDREAHVLAGGALPVRPRDEPLEPFHGRRRRRDEARDLFGRQRREERRRIARPQLAQRHQRAGQLGKAAAPAVRLRASMSASGRVDTSASAWA